MKTKQISYSILLFVIGFTIACSKNNSQPGNQMIPPGTPATCDGVNAKFATDVFPIIQTKCATGSGCHGTGSLNGPGALTNLSQITNAAAGIKAAVVSGRMPLVGTLSATEIKQIRCWVDNGALDN
jgi:hypothetical protein